VIWLLVGCLLVGDILLARKVRQLQIGRAVDLLEICALLEKLVAQDDALAELIEEKRAAPFTIELSQN
jgi:hypothetical protein